MAPGVKTTFVPLMTTVPPEIAVTAVRLKTWFSMSVSLPISEAMAIVRGASSVPATVSAFATGASLTAPMFTATLTVDVAAPSEIV